MISGEGIIMVGSCTAEHHSFEPRYNEIINPEVIKQITELCKSKKRLGSHGNIIPDEILNAAKDKIYVCDICRYCGAKVE